MRFGTRIALRLTAYEQETTSSKTAVLALLDSPCFSVIVICNDFCFNAPNCYCKSSL